MYIFFLFLFYCVNLNLVNGQEYTLEKIKERIVVPSDFDGMEIHTELSDHVIAKNISDFLSELNKIKKPDEYANLAQKELLKLFNSGCIGIISNKFSDYENFKFFEVYYFLFDSSYQAKSSFETIRSYKGKLMNKVFLTADKDFTPEPSVHQKFYYFSTKWGDKYLTLIQKGNLVLYINVENKEYVKQVAGVVLKKL